LNHDSPLIFGKMPKVKHLSEDNEAIRVEYGEIYEGETIESFWQYVCFTDEAHMDPGDEIRDRILRPIGIRFQTRCNRRRGNIGL